jgi:hypothetical protein
MALKVCRVPFTAQVLRATPKLRSGSGGVRTRAAVGSFSYDSVAGPVKIEVLPTEEGVSDFLCKVGGVGSGPSYGRSGGILHCLKKTADPIFNCQISDILWRFEKKLTPPYPPFFPQN